MVLTINVLKRKSNKQTEDFDQTLINAVSDLGLYICLQSEKNETPCLEGLIEVVGGCKGAQLIHEWHHK